MTNSHNTPTLFVAGDPDDAEALARLRKSQPSLQVVDTLADQLTELAEIDHPGNLGKPAAPIEVRDTDGVWAYYPWRNTVVRTLPEPDYRRLRTSRNQLLITPEQQTSLAHIRVAIAGLNVGNPAAVCLALEGGAERMRFADFDTLSVSNLNRFRAGLSDLGQNKAVLSARQVYEINPYARLEVWKEGIKPGEEAGFLEDIDLLVEEMDNLPLKLSIREEARRRRIPVIMVTGNGANVIIDIERFDTDPDLPLLNGHLKPAVIGQIKNPKPVAGIQARVLLARDFMGQEFLTPELRASFLQIGQTLAGIPQLAESSFLRGAAVCHMVRRIAIGAPAPSGRYNLNLDEVISQ
jgi:hypothetical protein